MSPELLAAARTYAAAGWPVFPITADKTGIPNGVTGAEGKDAGAEQIEFWFTRGVQYQRGGPVTPPIGVAIRMPDGVVGIDVDHYGAKTGADTLAAREAQWGPLPPTWSSTARDAGGPSRIRFYRIPAGVRLAGGAGESIDVIQRHHRYAAVAPSINPKTGTPYVWYAPDGTPAAGMVPKPEWFPELPAAWLAGLSEGASAPSGPSASVGAGQAFLDALRADEADPCPGMAGVMSALIKDAHAADEGSRHDAMTKATHGLVHTGAEGHHGYAQYEAELREVWEALTETEARTDEFDRMLLTSARKAAAAAPRGVPGLMDECSVYVVRESRRIAEAMPAQPVPVAESGGVRYVAQAPPNPAAVVMEGIGVSPFDPPYGTDQGLAEAVLERVAPVVRHTIESGQWLLKRGWTWEQRADLTGWAVSRVAPLMPPGDKEGDDEDKLRAARRTRLMQNAGGSAVAAKMRALVAGGDHPVCISESDLDADPEVLWCGGLPFHLRYCDEAPVLARVDPAVPHVHSTRYVPEVRPTPRWDAFIAQVWPDAEVRAWALRILGITLTGYPDAALPILLGESRRGKTAVVNLVMDALGSYAHAADARLLGSELNTHAAIVYALKGRRLAFIDEGPRPGAGATERLKQLTGGGQLTGNPMRGNPVTFTPSHTLVLTTNEPPAITDPALAKRVRFILCSGDELAVRTTRMELGEVGGPVWQAEAPGVLAKLMAEAAGWLGDRDSALPEKAPLAIRFAVDEIAAEQDTVGQWIAERCEPAKPGTQAMVLFTNYREYCAAAGIHTSAVLNVHKWGRALTDRGYPSDPTRTGKLRPLSLRSGGGWAPSVPPVTNQSVTRDQPAGQSVTEQNRRSDTVSSIFVTDVTNQNTISSSNREREYTAESNSALHTVTDCAVSTGVRISGETREIGSQGHRVTGTVSDLHKQPCDPLAESVTDPAPVLVQDAQGVWYDPATRKPPKKRPKMTEAEKAERAAERKAAQVQARAADRLQAIAEAEGGEVPLPALMLRDGRMHGPASLEVVRSVITGCIARSGSLAVDVEHTGYPIGHRDYALRTIQLGDELAGVVLDATDPAQVELARELVLAAPVLHAHSATADIIPMALAAGMGYPDELAEDMWARMHDTAIIARVTDPASATSDEAGLKQLAGALLHDAAVAPGAEAGRKALFAAGKWLTDTKAHTPVDRSGWAQVNHATATMVRYDASDVLDCAAVARRLTPMPADIAERERLTQRVTARIPLRGVPLDPEWTAARLTERQDAEREVTGELSGYGIENPGSNDQVAAVALKLGAELPPTKAGKPSVAKDALMPYTAYTDTELGRFAALVMDYRKAAKLRQAFLDPYSVAITAGDGRVRPTVYTLGADTNRMSCVRPNLQQVPREGGIRGCIVADPGMAIISADFSSVEVRVMAALSQDEALMRILAEGADLHTIITEQILGVSKAEAERTPEGKKRFKQQRYFTKRGVFGWAYGGAPENLAAQVGTTPEIMRAVVDTLIGLAPGYANWREVFKAQINAGVREFRTYSGRIVHIKPEAHKGPNYAVQGTARELLVDTLCKWDREQWRTATLWPVHDEVLGLVPADQAAAATECLTACMTTSLYGVDIVAEASDPTDRWADAA